MTLSEICPFDIWRLCDVCRVHPVDGRRVRPAGWIARIGWSGPARPAWFKAAAARFRYRPGWGHIVAAARLQPTFVYSPKSLAVSVKRLTADEWYSNILLIT